MVVVPCRIGDEDVFWAECARTEERGEVVGACAGDRLNACDVVRDARAEEECADCGEESGVAGDGEVFVVDVLVVQGLFGLRWSQVSDRCIGFRCSSLLACLTLGRTHGRQLLSR